MTKMRLEDIRPVGHRILLRTEVVDKIKDLGDGKKLYMMSDTQQKRKEAGNYCHTVVSVGPTAYKHESFQGEVWCKPGDKVITAQYPGQKLNFEEGFTAWFANDEDILAILESNDG